MCLFKKWREKKRAKKLSMQESTNDKELKVNDTEEIARNKELSNGKQEENKERSMIEKETVEKLKIRPFSKPKVFNQEENELPKKEVIVEDDIEIDDYPDEPENEIIKEENASTELIEESKESKAKQNDVTKKASSRKYQGKYEVYPESNYYKFRLKASNGEILAVSFRYSTERGAMAGIDTFKKNVQEGHFKVITDKNNFSQFNLYNSNGARVIMVGEMYQSVSNANSAIDSVKSFYDTDKIESLDSIPKSEIREEQIEFEPVEESNMGKYELFKENEFYYIRLKASNSQVLFISQGYASKASAKSGLKTIHNAIKDKNFTISRDKQNRYQFNLYSSTGQILVTGETYSQKSNGISAIHSVLKFGLKAVLTEL